MFNSIINFIFLAFSFVLCFILGCNNPAASNHSLLSFSIPPHEYYVRSNIMWGNGPKPDYLKRIGKNENDTMIILTKEKLIYIVGQYGLNQFDSLLIPYSGEFGIKYKVVDNKNFKPQVDKVITIGTREFLRNRNVNFQWWPEIIDKIKRNGKGTVIVSGP